MLHFNDKCSYRPQNRPRLVLIVFYSEIICSIAVGSSSICAFLWLGETCGCLPVVQLEPMVGSISCSSLENTQLGQTSKQESCVYLGCSITGVLVGICSDVDPGGGDYGGNLSYFCIFKVFSWCRDINKGKKYALAHFMLPLITDRYFPDFK